MIVESARVSLENLNDKMLGRGADERIQESVTGLKSRNKGINELTSTWDTDNNFEKLFSDLNEIE